ncbi:MAG: farnesyl-diphosphate synthase [Kordiimonas sp.]|nr:farnesyl-diphosphate synthase [Kordiimonas sp.]|tara:strand:- start:907 stop:1830 length:924 start_codon:yes stop_codon:yes gene_type:complete
MNKILTLSAAEQAEYAKQHMLAAAEDIEGALLRLMPQADGMEEQVMAAMRYALMAGGKRIRPFLVLCSASLFGVDRDFALRVAAAVECAHTYSLVHDDLPCMDDADLRRGKPSLHKKFDEATAVLAGDALLTLCFEILASPETHADPKVRCELMASLSRALGAQGMVGGQMIDLLAEERSLNEGEIIRLQRLKTGALIAFSAEAGAIMGKAADVSRQALHGYAHDLGLAFQIVDDLLDVEGDSAALGKTAGRDAVAGKATLVSLLGVERARLQTDMLIEQAEKHLDIFDDQADILRAVLQFVITRAH